jgi:hypothetical protein
MPVKEITMIASCLEPILLTALAHCGRNLAKYGQLWMKKITFVSYN